MLTFLKSLFKQLRKDGRQLTCRRVDVNEEMVTSVTLPLSYPSGALQELFSEQLLLQYPIISLLSERHTDGVAGEEEQEKESRSK